MLMWAPQGHVSMCFLSACCAYSGLGSYSDTAPRDYSVTCILAGRTLCLASTWSLLSEKTDPGMDGAAEPSSANSILVPRLSSTDCSSDGLEELVLTMPPGEHTGNSHGITLRGTQISICPFSSLPPISQERERMTLSYTGKKRKPSKFFLIHSRTRRTRYRDRVGTS